MGAQISCLGEQGLAGFTLNKDKQIIGDREVLLDVSVKNAVILFTNSTLSGLTIESIREKLDINSRIPRLSQVYSTDIPHRMENYCDFLFIILTELDELKKRNVIHDMMLSKKVFYLTKNSLGLKSIPKWSKSKLRDFVYMKDGYDVNNELQLAPLRNIILKLGVHQAMSFHEPGHGSLFQPKSSIQLWLVDSHYEDEGGGLLTDYPRALDEISMLVKKERPFGIEKFQFATLRKPNISQLYGDDTTTHVMYTHVGEGGMTLQECQDWLAWLVAECINRHPDVSFPYIMLSVTQRKYGEWLRISMSHFDLNFNLVIITSEQPVSRSHLLYQTLTGTLPCIVGRQP